MRNIYLRNIPFLMFLLLFIPVSTAFAKGVLAGTKIENSVALVYQVGGIDYAISSNTVIDVVDQVIDVQIVSNDPSNVATSPSSTNQILNFSITNLGNGEDTFDLNYESNSTNSFDVTNSKIYLDTNNNGLFDIAVDTQISQITLQPDEQKRLFLISDIPSQTYPTGSLSTNSIVATSQIGGSGVAGTQYAGAGVDGVWAVDGTSGGVDRAFGTYEMIDISLKLRKSYKASSSDIYSGTILTYTIDVEAVGIGTLEDVVVSDVIPNKTSYVANSLKLDTESLSDSIDSDIGHFNGNEVRVEFGDVTQNVAGEFKKTILFQVVVD